MEQNIKVSLRKARFRDIEFLWYLRNREDVFKFSKNARPVSWAEHINWLMPILLGFSKKSLFIIQFEQQRAGQARLDWQDGGYTLNIALLKEFRGQGIAKKALFLALKYGIKEKQARFFKAEIHFQNKASLRLFAALNFKLESRKGPWLNYVFSSS